MISIGLIGATGKWGKVYAKTIKNHFPNVKLIPAGRDSWKNLSVDGVIISTPPSSHIEIAKRFLDKRIPVLIEKPLALSLKEAEELIPYDAPILVNHIHLFSKAYQKMKKEIGQIDLIASFGCGPGPVRDYSSLIDYGCHDISMILDLAGKFPNKASVSEDKTKKGSLFTLQLEFDDFTTISVVGNGSNTKQRVLMVSDDGESHSYSEADNIDNPPLIDTISVFLDTIEGKKDYRLGLDLSLKVMKVLDICQKQISANK
jgi:predicted dehydrogenase